jgi:HSP20 family protein
MAKVNETKPAVRRGDLELRRESVQRLFDQWFEDFWSRPFSRLRGPDFWPQSISPRAPALDVFEQKNELIVKTEIPGLTKDEIDIRLDGNVLTIKGQKKKDEDIKEHNYYRRERVFGTFFRRVELPVEIHADKVNAVFKGGVLEIRLPIKDTPRRNSIKVNIA